MNSTNTDNNADNDDVWLEINKSDIWFVIVVGLCVFMLGHGCGAALNQMKMERHAVSNGVLYSVTNTVDGKPVYLWKTNNNQTPNN